MFFLVACHAYGEEITIPEFMVIGDGEPTVSTNASSTQVLSGKDLDRKRAATLGETLSNEAGVSSSSFGAAASRPVLRGLSGDRVRILENGTGVVDASTASADHTTAIEPMTIERIEITRGPESLLFGTSIVGGVVNTITTRIPEALPEAVNAQAETHVSSVDGGVAGAAAIETEVSKRWALHMDASSRNARDYVAPAFGRVENSFNNAWNASVGTSRIFANGYVGGSFSKYGSNYGTIAEKNVAIKMNQERYDLSLGLKNLGWIQSLKFKNTFSNYRHQEVTGDLVGTTFRNIGDEARIEIGHNKVGDYSGRFGVQVGTFAFEALGDEAFLPATENQAYSAFVFEEAKYEDFEPSFSVRVDQTGVRSKDSATFGAADSRSFTSASGAAAGLFHIDAVNSVTVTIGHAERAPNYQELFANGAHVATRSFEVGNRNLERERSESAEISYRHKREKTEMALSIHAQDFKNFIALTSTGGTRLNAEGVALPEYRYAAIDALIYGGEIELKHQFENIISGGDLETTFKLDLIHGFEKATRISLPRMMPMRESIGVNYKAARYSTGLEFERVEKQSEIARNETATDAYNLVNVFVEAPLHWSGALFDIFLKAQNVLDVDARNHISILKNEAPLPGRNLTFGLHAVF